MKLSKHTCLLSEPGAEQGCPEGRAPAPGQRAQHGQNLKLAPPAPWTLPSHGRDPREAKGHDFSRHATWNVNTGIRADAGV